MSDPLVPPYAARQAPVLLVETQAIDLAAGEPLSALLDLLLELGPRESLAWLGGVGEVGDEGSTGRSSLLGWGCAWRLYLPATDDDSGERFAAADAAWQALADAAVVHDEVRRPGTGLVGFGSFAFDPRSAAGSTLIVPQVLFGCRDGVAWVTTTRRLDAPSGMTAATLDAPQSERPTADAAESDDSTKADWLRKVDRALALLADAHQQHPSAPSLAKVVLARAAQVPLSAPVDPAAVLRRLAAEYPTTWTFAVDGLIGATPELLVRNLDGQVWSRVLAGTRSRQSSLEAAELTADQKELTEHRFAVESVVSALRPFCRTLDWPETPAVIELPNVLHLATDIVGEITTRPSVLRLVGALHPTAAVCGAPRAAALAAIRELEDFDRGRYSGPVGWLDGSGHGEWGIALRCGEIGSGRTARIFAGCGIVLGSDPEAEWAESEAKLAPMRSVLSAG